MEESRLRHRRSPNDNIGRDHQCFCGKSYLTSSALWTHKNIKHKHTPLKDFKGSLIEEYEQEFLAERSIIGLVNNKSFQNFPDPDKSDKTHKKIAEEKLVTKKFQEQFDVFDKSYSKSKKKLPKLEQKNKEDSSDCNIPKKSSKILEVSENPTKKSKIYEADDETSNLKSQKSSNESDRASLICTNDLESSNLFLNKINTWTGSEETCDDVFIEYLLENERILSKADYSFLIESILKYRECTNYYFNTLTDPPDTKKDYSAVSPPDLLPQVSNFYLIKFLPSTLPVEDKLKQTSFVYDFCQWLSSKDLTDFELTFINKSIPI